MSGVPLRRVLVVGGGPAGLYSAALLRRAFPDTQVRVVDRNREGATYGWGVVFSEQTLGALEQADRLSYDQICDSFARWDAIDVHFRNTFLRAYGHGFSGMSRKRLLAILTRRCIDLDVTIEHETEFDDLSQFADYDLVIAADGLRSGLRTVRADHFGPRFDTRSAKYIWYGTSRRPEMFTYLVMPTEWGVFQGTPYPYSDDHSTFVIECSDQVWQRAGLDRMSEDQSREFCEELFSEFLAGHPLLSNRSKWMNFVTVKNRTWVDGNVVLVGDAAHTVHFSIGSGTKLAMEDAIGLVDALRKNERLPEALAYFENGRLPVAEAFQDAAQQSLLWFEALDRNLSLEPEQFVFNFLTRSGRISYDEVRQRDPRFADTFDRWFARAARGSRAPKLITPGPLFTPLRLVGGTRGTVANRAVLPVGNAMTTDDGIPGAQHERAVLHRVRGGAGSVLTDVVAVCPDARITTCDAGLWNDDQTECWAKIVDKAHCEGEALLITRLGHAGSRGATAPRSHGIDQPLRGRAWPLLAPTSRPYVQNGTPPKAMDGQDMTAVVGQFRDASERAVRAGFDGLEIHAGHGYLLGSFLSPLTNTRTDEYGGDLDCRLRFPLEVFAAAREVWPRDRLLSVCVNADDWAPGGAGVAEAIEIVRSFMNAGCGLVHLVAGQSVASSRPRYGPYFLASLAEQIRIETGAGVMIRGRITSTDEANTVIAGGRADLCVLDLPGLAEFDQSQTSKASLHDNAVAVPPVQSKRGALSSGDAYAGK